MKRPPTISRTGRLAVLALCAAQFVLILDVVIINVAIPSIRRDLAMVDTRVQLIGIAYTVTFGSLLIVCGRAGDLVGRRRMLMAGLGLFIAASVAAGAAQLDWQLFIARAGQGVGAAMVSANALASITATIDEGPGRNWAIGLWAGVGSAGAIAGQLVGGPSRSSSGGGGSSSSTYRSGWLSWQYWPASCRTVATGSTAGWT